jgi:transcriptional regulator with XRE-family HTH domain
MSQLDWQAELERRAVGQRELAERAGLHPSTVHRIVTGERRGRPETRRRLHDELASFPILEMS